MGQHLSSKSEEKCVKFTHLVCRVSAIRLGSINFMEERVNSVRTSERLACFHIASGLAFADSYNKQMEW
jgi:hypothetical protein